MSMTLQRLHAGIAWDNESSGFGLVIRSCTNLLEDMNAAAITEP